ncbi:hypothetical protein ACERIT_14480 [Halopenitus sp. H-Gu1]
MTGDSDEESDKEVTEDDVTSGDGLSYDTLIANKSGEVTDNDEES